MRIAVLGTGIMGTPIAENIAKAGHEVVVWNRTREKAERVEGAEVVDEPETGARGADVRPRRRPLEGARGARRQPGRIALRQVKGKMMVSESFEPSFPLALALKDARLVLEADDLPVTRVVAEQMARAVELGHGDSDMAATYWASIQRTGRAHA